MKSEISSKLLAKCAQDASKRAVEKAFALGIPIVKQQGHDIVREYPDGRTEIIGHLERTNIRPKRRTYQLS